MKSKLPSAYKTSPWQQQVSQCIHPYVPFLHHCLKHTENHRQTVKEKENNAFKKRNFFFLKSDEG
jgi:hypothetical protein